MKSPPPLTKRLKEIVDLAAEGKTDKEIAHVTGLAEGTLRTYWDRLRHRYEARSRTEVIAKALVRPGDDFKTRLLYKLPLFVWTANRSGYVDFCNEWFVKWGGLTAEEAVGKGCRALMPEDELAESEARWNRAQETGKAYEALVHFRCGPDRQLRPHKICLFPILGEDGQIEKWIGYGRELAENADQQMVRFLKAMLV